jgi:hypothetical protein
MYDDFFGYRCHKETMRHAQSESAKYHQPSPDFFAYGTAKRCLSAYIVSQNRSVETDVYIDTSPNRSISSHTIEKVGNATEGLTDCSLKANGEINTALYRETIYSCLTADIEHEGRR